MGFRQGAYASVWEVSPLSDTFTKCRISISRKNKTTGEYETDFSGYVGFVGTLSADKASKLSEKDRIKLGDVDVTTKYDKEKKITYTNYRCFSFDLANPSGNTHNEPEQPTESTPEPTDSYSAVDEDSPF